MGGAEAAMRPQKPVGQHAVLGHAVEHAVGADDGRIDRPGQDEEPHQHHEGVQQQPGQRRADDVHRQAADEIVGIVLHADFIGDQQHGQEADAGREHDAVDEDDEGRLLEIGQLGRLDLAIDLGQGLLAAHGQDRMAEGQHDPDQAHQAQPVAGLPQLGGERGKEFGHESQRIFRLAGGLVEPGDGVAVFHFFDEPAGLGIALPDLAPLAGDAIRPRDDLVLDLRRKVRGQGDTVHRPADQAGWRRTRRGSRRP